MEAKPGDRVRATTDEEQIEGTLMPPSDNCVIIKLDTGYNVGIKTDSVIKTEVLKKYASPIHEHSKTKQRKDLPIISILHTGGTIASKVDYDTGGVVSRFDPEELVALFPELKDIATIRSRLLTQMFSEDIRLGHYNIMAQAVTEEFAAGAKGVIITHGTDTLHYTSAILSFMLSNPPGPIIILGAQRSSDRASTDAAVNVLCAAHFIMKTDFAGVAICMHDTMNDNGCAIIPGVHARKMHSSRRDAFEAINVLPWARVRYPEGAIEWKMKDYPKRTGEFGIQLVNEKLNVGMLYTHPNLSKEEIHAYEGFDGLVLIGTGLGHFPVTKIDDLTEENEKNLEAIKALAQEMPVVMTSQTIAGEINMNVYATGRKLIEAGVLGNHTTNTPETAFAKLVYLLSVYDKKAVKDKYHEPLAGELVQLHETPKRRPNKD